MTSMTSMTSVRLKNLELFCAQAGRLEQDSISIVDGVILSEASQIVPPSDLVEIDCSGLIATQGFVDLLAEGGEPGDEHREDFKSLARAALTGGFTTVCVSPDTQPVNDARSVTEWIHRRAELDAEIEIFPIAAATRSLQGEALSDIFDLKEAGVAVSPGLGFGEYGEGYVRFGLIENEHRTRQALRGIKKVLRAGPPSDWKAE